MCRCQSSGSLQPFTVLSSLLPFSICPSPCKSWLPRDAKCEINSILSDQGTLGPLIHRHRSNSHSTLTHSDPSAADGVWGISMWQQPQCSAGSMYGGGRQPAGDTVC